MDPLSIAASIGGLTCACLTIAKKLSDLGSSLSGASQTISSLHSETRLVSFSLSQFQSLLLGDVNSVPSQALLDTEVLSALDVSVTGCAVILSCLDDETRSLVTNIENDKRFGIVDKVKTGFKDGKFKELLGQLRGQCSGITFLLNCMQMKSIADIHQSVHENGTTIRQLVEQTQLLRARYPQVKIANSVLEVPWDGDSIIGGGVHASTISDTEFLFDDLVVDSKSYRRAMKDAKRGKRREEVVHGDLLDLGLVLVDIEEGPEQMLDDLGVSSYDVDLLLLAINEDEASGLETALLESCKYSVASGAFTFRFTDAFSRILLTMPASPLSTGLRAEGLPDSPVHEDRVSPGVSDGSSATMVPCIDSEDQTPMSSAEALISEAGITFKLENPPRFHQRCMTREAQRTVPGPEPAQSGYGVSAEYQPGGIQRTISKPKGPRDIMRERTAREMKRKQVPSAPNQEDSTASAGHDIKIIDVRASTSEGGAGNTDTVNSAPKESSFPHAFERWERLSAHWEGLTSFWIRRLEENSADLDEDKITQQLPKQVKDLSAAGSNLFHAVVELQRLRASSERKFQRWFFETRAKEELAEERYNELKKERDMECGLAAREIASLVETRDEMQRMIKFLESTLQASKEELRRAWEELQEQERSQRPPIDILRPTLIDLKSNKATTAFNVYKQDELIEREESRIRRATMTFEQEKRSRVGYHHGQDQINLGSVRRSTNDLSIMATKPANRIMKDNAGAGKEFRHHAQNRAEPLATKTVQQTTATGLTSKPPILGATSVNEVRQQVKEARELGDAYTFRTGTSKTTINNPKLLETVEDAIRRLILPELKALDKEPRRHQTRGRKHEVLEEREDNDPDRRYRRTRTPNLTISLASPNSEDEARQARKVVRQSQNTNLDRMQVESTYQEPSRSQARVTNFCCTVCTEQELEDSRQRQEEPENQPVSSLKPKYVKEAWQGPAYNRA